MALQLKAMASEDNSGITANQAVQKLMEGNLRFVSGNLAHPDQSAQRRAEVISAQYPFAVIVSCSDSRVPPEIIFDQGIGDIFVVRTAGQVIDNVTLGSIEYAIEHLNVPLVVVLGHDSCGAVKAAVAGGEAPGHIGSLVDAISPAVKKARAMNGDLLNNSIDINIQNIVINLILSQPILSKAINGGKLKIVGARYALNSGAVKMIE
jgi:carbonic anhydrase